MRVIRSEAVTLWVHVGVQNRPPSDLTCLRELGTWTCVHWARHGQGMFCAHVG